MMVVLLAVERMVRSQYIRDESGPQPPPRHFSFIRVHVRGKHAALINTPRGNVPTCSNRGISETMKIEENRRLDVDFRVAGGWNQPRKGCTSSAFTSHQEA